MTKEQLIAMLANMEANAAASLASGLLALHPDWAVDVAAALAPAEPAKEPAKEPAPKSNYARYVGRFLDKKDERKTRNELIASFYEKVNEWDGEDDTFATLGDPEVRKDRRLASAAPTLLCGLLLTAEDNDDGDAISVSALVSDYSGDNTRVKVGESRLYVKVAKEALKEFSATIEDEAHPEYSNTLLREDIVLLRITDIESRKSEYGRRYLTAKSWGTPVAVLRLNDDEIPRSEFTIEAEDVIDTTKKRRHDDDDDDDEEESNRSRSKFLAKLGLK